MPKFKTTEQFIIDATTIHGDKYKYSLTVYVNVKSKVKIVCPLHGIFEQTPNNHLRGQGCKKCGRARTSTIQRRRQDDLIKNAVQVHSNKYDYSLVDYKNHSTKVKIICPLHGIFEQLIYTHIKGYGCSKCKGDKISSSKLKTTEEFISDAWCEHGDRYNYKLVDYNSVHDKIKIICPVHGIFEQSPSNHLHGYNCSSCASIGTSQQEIELQQWLKQHIDIKINDRLLIKPLELDIIIPSKKIAIEYNGLYWHSEQRGKNRYYHLNKYNLCKEKGYRLIQVWENEWLHKKDIVKSIIMSAIGLYDIKIGARQCSIVDVDSKTARVFYNNNHIQGFFGGKHKGLICNNELISLMTIDSKNELQRFANKIGYQVHGSFSKLLKSFNINGNITTFSDLRYFTGDVYRKNGFIFQYDSKPNYFYFDSNRILYNRITFQKHKLKDKLNTFNPDQTEYQNMVNNGYDRIWDCGNIKFIR